MKKMIVALALFAGIYTAADAQQKGQKQGKERTHATAEQRAEARAGRLQKTLNLTDAQRQAIYESDLATAKEMQPLKENQQMTREKIKTMQDQREAKLKSILTPEQYKKLEQMKADRRAKMAQRHAERKPQRLQNAAPRQEVK